MEDCRDYCRAVLQQNVVFFLTKFGGILGVFTKNCFELFLSRDTKVKNKMTHENDERKID